MKNYCESTRVVIQLLQYQNKVRRLEALAPPGVPAQHPWLGLAAGRPGGLPERGEVRPARPVRPRPRLLHHGQQRGDQQLQGHPPRDAQVNGPTINLVRWKKEYMATSHKVILAETLSPTFVGLTFQVGF